MYSLRGSNRGLSEGCVTDACTLGGLTPVGGVVQIVVEPVGGGALLEEVSHHCWGGL